MTSILTFPTIETVVDITTPSHEPVTVALVGGGFVTVWDSYYQDGDEGGIYAQLFDANGVQIGTEFLVNTVTTGMQRWPSVTALSTGGFVVTYDSPDSSAAGQKAQIFTATGTKVGSEFQVNSHSPGIQTQGEVATLSNGNLVFTWNSYGQAGPFNNIYAKIVDSSGVTVVPEFRMLTTPYEIFLSDVAALTGGGFVILGRAGDNNGTSIGVHMRVYTNSGVPIAETTLANQTLAGLQLNASVAGLANGGFVVTWDSEVTAGVSDIIAQRFDAAGNRIGGEVTVNTYTTGHQDHADIAALSDGGYVITWQSSGQDGSFTGIYAQRFDEMGNKIGPEFIVNTTTASYQNFPEVAALPNGGFTVTWQGGADPSSIYASTQIFQRSFTNAANTAGGQVLYGTVAGDVLNGGAGADTMYGGFGDDTYHVDNAADSIVELAGQGTGDTVVSPFTYTLSDPFLENLTLDGSANINGTGNASNNIIFGNSGNNLIDGLQGIDIMAGGLGNDTYIVESIYDAALELSGQGVDTVQSSVTFTLISAHVENLTLTGSANINGTGNGLNNVLTGNSGANLIDGGQGSDTMIGGMGSDTFIVDSINDVVSELAGQGVDAIQSSVTFTLSAHVENLTLSGSANINGTGNADANVITGNSGHNLLSGGGGADTLVGGAGNDTFIVDSVDDVVNEASGQGTDTILSSVSYSLAAVGRRVEKLTLVEPAGADTVSNTSATGNDMSNVLTGTAGNNVLDGGTGNDTLIGGYGNDTYIVDAVGDVVTEVNGQGTDTVLSSVAWSLSGGHAENLTLTGTANIDATGNNAANVLIGNSGNNRLDGGNLGDTMSGGAGDDTYIINSANDVVIENAGEGIDTVRVNRNHTLGTHFEHLVLLGSGNFDAAGNALDNSLAGNTGNNILSGLDGNDILNGGFGADTMRGGLGNDTYVVNEIGDVVTELSGQGIDTVQSSISFNLTGLFAENIILTGSANINATGNGQANALTGNGFNNVLNGLVGADSMAGGGGDDSYYVDNLGDVVIEAANNGTDTVFSSVSFSLSGIHAEVLQLTGSGNVSVTGNNSANTLVGNNGNNTLNGLGGADILTGGLGADLFLFGTGSGADSISDFSRAQGDQININAYTGGIANAGLVAQSGLHVLISLGGSNIITVQNATTADVLTQIVW